MDDKCSYYVASKTMGQFYSSAAINGQPIDLEAVLFPCNAFTSDRISQLKKTLWSAKPFPHLVIDNLFDLGLLAEVEREFSDMSTIGRTLKKREEFYDRSPRFPKLGPASALYFNIANSTHMVEFLSELTGIDALITDASLEYGGLHMCRAGGKFGVHLDFTHSKTSKLKNRFILMTYLNRDWKEEYNGSLELWNADASTAVTSILPIFGRSVIMMQGDKSFHGHPAPLNPPEGRVRRSLATYYYTNDAQSLPEAYPKSTLLLSQLRKNPKRASGSYLQYLSMGWKGRCVVIAKQIMPPMLWPLLERPLKIYYKAQEKITKSRLR